MTNRRTMFLHRGAALGVPLFFDGAVRQPAIDGLPGTRCDEDPVVAEVLRQFRAGLRAQRAGRGEGARQAASALRVMAAYGKAAGLDEQFRDALQREVDTYGGDGVLSRRLSFARFAAEARESGLDPAPDLTDPDIAVRRRVLESLLTLGMAPHLLGAAEFFDAAGADLDARGKLPHAPPAAIGRTCRQDLAQWVSRTEAAMSIACLSPSVAPCPFFAGVYIGARIHEDACSGRGSAQEFG